MASDAITDLGCAESLDVNYRNGIAYPGTNIGPNQTDWRSLEGGGQDPRPGPQDGEALPCQPRSPGRGPVPESTNSMLCNFPNVRFRDTGHGASSQRGVECAALETTWTFSSLVSGSVFRVP